MAALNNTIVIGSSETPLFTFSNENIASASSDQAVALSGEELSIDTATFEVLQEIKEQYVYRPVGDYHEETIQVPEIITTTETVIDGLDFSQGTRGIAAGNRETDGTTYLTYEFVLTTNDFAPYVGALLFGNTYRYGTPRGTVEQVYGIKIVSASSTTTKLRMMETDFDVPTGKFIPGRKYKVTYDERSAQALKANVRLDRMDDTGSSVAENLFDAESSFSVSTNAYLNIGTQRTESDWVDVPITFPHRFTAYQLYRGNTQLISYTPYDDASYNRVGVYNSVDGSAKYGWLTSVGIAGHYHTEEVQHTVYHEETIIVEEDYKDGYLDTNGYVYCEPYTDDIRNIPYGTPLTWYNDGVLMGRFFVKNIERLAPSRWKINAMSYIGIIDRQTHYGGVYGANGEQIRFRDVASEILGDDSDHVYYQAVEYIQSRGGRYNAYINTGVKNEFDVRMEVDYDLTQADSSDNYICGQVTTTQFTGTAQEIKRQWLIYDYYKSGENWVENTESYLMTMNQVEYMIDGMLNEAAHVATQFWPYPTYEQAYADELEIMYQRYKAEYDGELYAGLTLAATIAGNTNTKARLKVGNDYVDVELSASPSGRHTISVSDYEIAFDGQTVASSTANVRDILSKRVNRDFYESAKFLHIFGANDEGTDPNARFHKFHPAMKVYGARIYKDDALVRDFRPCYRCSDNVIGMYDAVSKSFFTSETENTFWKGNDTTSDIRNLNGEGWVDPTDELRNLFVVGYLPIDTRRNNLYQLCFAYNVNIVKDAYGNIDFQYLKQQLNPATIPDERIYENGSLDYSEPCTEVDVVEHTYFYNPSSSSQSLMPPEELLYDSSAAGASSTEEVFVRFENAPIYVPTLNAGGNLQIIERGVNYAIVKGTGYLYGRPYVHTTHIISKKAEVENAGQDEKVLKVENATLVNPLNGAGVLNRMWEYYRNGKTIHDSIILGNEKCADCVALNDPFNDHVVAYINKMTINASSFLKADLELIEGYTPVIGTYYSDYVLLADSSGTWEVPAGVTKIYGVLIGGGSSGARGGNGTAGATGYSGAKDFGSGGTGGAGGIGGDGGKILTFTIVSPASSYNYSCGAGASFGGTPGNTVFGAYTSADGASADFGVTNLLTGEVYGYKGTDGVKGGNGGGGTKMLPAEGATYNGFTYYGGANAEYADKTGFSVYWCSASNGFGGGAACGSIGGSAPTPNNDVQTGAMIIWEPIVYPSVIWYSAGGGAGGNGANARRGADGETYGCGGCGGHGGGGGGAGGWAVIPGSGICQGGAGGQGGLGSEGGSGRRGAVLLYLAY